MRTVSSFILVIVRCSEFHLRQTLLTLTAYNPSPAGRFRKGFVEMKSWPGNGVPTNLVAIHVRLSVDNKNTFYYPWS